MFFELERVALKSLLCLFFPLFFQTCKRSAARQRSAARPGRIVSYFPPSHQESEKEFPQTYHKTLLWKLVRQGEQI
eukprot:g18708.t1